MRLQLTIISLICFFLPLSTPVFAASSASTETDYFKALEQIKRLPTGSVPVPPCSIDEKKHVLELLRQDGIQDLGDLQLSDDGRVFDRWS